LIFSTRDKAKWAGALRQMGIEPLTLSPSGGRA